MDYKEKYEKAVQAAMLAKQDTESAVTIRILEEIFPELKENEDERIRKEMITYLSTVEDKGLIPYESWIAWLKEQGEHANFRNKIQVGDKVTRNEDGVLVNLSQLKRVAKKDEKQREQNPAWSEEDEMIVLSIEQVMNCASLLNIVPEKIDKIRTWLKSLRPQNTWKPSEEQMKALQVFLAHGCAAPDKEASIAEEVVDGLYNDLKKLRGE